MKTSIFTAVFLVTLSLYSYKKNSIQDKELFEYKTIQGYSNYIQIEKNKNSIQGVILGVELNMEGIPVYYKSSFVYPSANISKKEENTIDFKLTKFDCSFKPFSFDSINKDLIKRDSDKIPFMLHFPITFFGNRKGDSLILKRNRTTSLSELDEMVFSKVIE